VSGSDAISPTAHYTGYVWFRNGLSDAALATRQGRLLFDSLQPAALVSRALGGPTLEGYLLARHAAIDALLTTAIERDGITQVLEIAAGLSPRGLRFARRYGERLTYVEADLPDMAARKQRALARAGADGSGHRVASIDALREGGPDSLEQLAATLDSGAGLVIITEGLLGYLPSAQVAALWRRCAQTLSGFSAGRYLSDLHLAGVQTPAVRAFRVLLSAFVRGSVHLHYDDADAAQDALRAAGFARARVRRAADIVAASDDPRPAGGAGAGLAHIVEASVTGLTGAR
jgi:O-methyltransferase involved in polyketide biosynthesis